MDRMLKVARLVLCSIWLLTCLMVSLTSAVELHVWPIGWTPEMTQYIKERVVPEFQKKHPGVDVVITPHTWDGGEKLILSTAAGVPPDLVMTGGTTVVNYVPTGLLQPIDRFLEQWENYDLVYPGAWANARWEGKTYSVPFTVDLRLIAYHMDVFAEVGLDPGRPLESWEEIEAAARLTTKLEGDTVVRRGITFSTALGNTGIPQNFGHFLIQLGGRLISNDSRTPLYNDELGRETLEYLKRLYDIGHPSGYGSPPSTGISDFAAQRLAMNPSASYTTPANLVTQNPDIAGQLGAFAPRRSPDRDPVALAFINGLGIPAASRHPEMAWDFIEQLLTHENARAFVELNGYMMPRVDLREWILTNRPALVPWFEAMDYVEVWPQIPGGLPGYTYLGDWVIKALLGEVAPAIALEQAEREQQILFDEYWADIERRTANVQGIN